MMKVDSNNHNNQAENNQPSNFSLRNTKIVLDNGTTASLIQKDFASVLRSTVSQNEPRFEEKKSEKTNDGKVSNEAEEDLKSNLKELKVYREEKREKSDSERNSENNQDKSFGNFYVNNFVHQNEFGFPGARMILHIADLERIISVIRAKAVAEGKQIFIELKRSVLQGLEIKLTIGKDKTVIAEFIAANENIKNQLAARAEELAGILRDRGVKLTKLEMSVGFESNNREYQNPNKSENISAICQSSNLTNRIKPEASSQTIRIKGSDISYQI